MLAGELRLGREVLNGRAFIAQDGALIHRRQEAGLIHDIAAAETAVRQHHVGRQIIAFAAEAVSYPSAHARMSQQQRSRAQHRDGRAVNERFMMARANDGQAVGVFSQFRKQIRNLQAGLPVTLERKRRGHQLAIRRFHELEREPFRIEAGGKRLAIEFAKQWFGIESFEMARPAGHEQEDHTLGLGEEVRRPRC